MRRRGNKSYKKIKYLYIREKIKAVDDKNG
jgi:hypothetical protein